MQKRIKLLMLVMPLLLVSNSCKVEQSVEPQYDVVGYGWEYAAPRDLGLNDSLIYAGFTQALNLGYINSIVIIRNGKIAATNYLNGATSSSVYDVKSVTKSYVSTFVGIAIQKGFLTLDTKVTDYFPTVKAAAPDKRVNDITVRHLLTMTSGIKPDETVFPSNLINNWAEYILSTPLDHDPGTYYNYSDAGAYILSALLTKATGMNTFTFAKTYFFDPLNYNLQGWFYSPEGIPIGGSTMMFTPKNMAVLGLLFLNKGKLNGQQIVPESWVDAATTNYTNWQNVEWGALKKVGYGYFWWTGEMNGHKIYSAIGYGGQFIFCVPDYNMVVGICADSYVSSTAASTDSDNILNLIGRYFVGAVK